MPDSTHQHITFEGRDEYQRKPVAEKAIQLLTSGIKVSPMVVDGDWGTGKTEFCYKFINLLSEIETDYMPVYVDAFRADHADEPLMTLLAAILAKLPEKDQPALIEKALPAARFAAKATFKAGLSWVLKQDAADLANDFDTDLKKVGDDLINHSIESLLKDHLKAEQSIELLQSALKELSKENPLVIFIDELDRCRPDFAVSVLENIKHVFDVEGVQFVLITNAQQLRASITHCYGGSEEGAKRYLDKFLGFSFELPQILSANFRHPDIVHEYWASIKHFDGLVRESDSLKGSLLINDDLQNFMRVLIKKNRLSLRDVERWVRHFEIYKIMNARALLRELYLGYALLEIVAIYLFTFQPAVVKGILNDQIPIDEILAIFGGKELPKLEAGYPNEIHIVMAMLRLEYMHKNPMDAVLSAREREAWEQQIQDWFRPNRIPRLGDRMDVIVKVVSSLTLR